MDIDTKRLNRKLKEVKEIAKHSESAIITLDDAIFEAKKLVNRLEKLKEIQEKNKPFNI